MSQLNSFRLPVLLFILANAFSPTMAQAHSATVSRNTVVNEFYRQGQAWAFRFLDKEGCLREMAIRKRDCFWTGETCKCVPEEVAIVVKGVTLSLMLSAIASVGTGLYLFAKACSQENSPMFAIPVGITGAALTWLGYDFLSQLRFVRQELKSLVSESNSSN